MVLLCSDTPITLKKHHILKTLQKNTKMNILVLENNKNYNILNNNIVSTIVTLDGDFKIDSNNIHPSENKSKNDKAEDNG
jgi:hypothetical protein